MRASGRFIVFEGGEGSGKSTQAALLADRLDAMLTREPGGTELGEQIRSLVLDRNRWQVSPRAELLLLVAARAQHVEEQIWPMLLAGRDVVCDRFSGSTLAYQGFGRGLNLDEVRTACRLGESGLSPDLTVLLDVPISEGLGRLSGDPDRIEGEGNPFHARVHAGFLELANEDKQGWAIVSGAGTIDEVANRVWSAVEDRLGPIALANR